MKDTIFQQLTDAISNIKDARNPYDEGNITESQAINAINNAIANLKLAKVSLEGMKK